MDQIYLDREQCDQLSLSYFEADTASIRADRILSSKWQGYDEKHTRYLQPLGSQVIVISRDRNNGPGWYKVID
jgi:hypothetical protein